MVQNLEDGSSCLLVYVHLSSISRIPWFGFGRPSVALIARYLLVTKERRTERASKTFLDNIEEDERVFCEGMSWKLEPCSGVALALLQNYGRLAGRPGSGHRLSGFSSTTSPSLLCPNGHSAQ